MTSYTFSAGCTVPIDLGSDRTEQLSTRRPILIEYLLSCAREQDWHGVSDAANDLREVDAELRGLRG